jgi:5-hydroxyisourate hydrolase-like protein (transthyretin family)
MIIIIIISSHFICTYIYVCIQKALKGEDFKAGVYEWAFYAGDYFATAGVPVSGQPFLDVIPLRFGIDNPEDHYHVPLLASPWSMSTYRGS